MNKLLLLGVFVSLVPGMTGCVTTFHEKHYFQTVRTVAGGEEPTNYYRLEVKGHVLFSSARYVSGYYDERAVDLFFDELKLKPTDSSTPNTRKLFTQTIPEPSDGGIRIKPLSPDAANGAFVMVLSTNASAVTGAIGQFSENQIVAEAMTNLANREIIRQAGGGVGSPRFEQAQAAVASGQIAGLVGLLPFDEANPDPGATKRGLLRVLSAIARARGGDENFTEFEQARAYFGANP